MGIPISLKIELTNDFPDPIPPVNPIILDDICEFMLSDDKLIKLEKLYL